MLSNLQGYELRGFPFKWCGMLQKIFHSLYGQNCLFNHLFFCYQIENKYHQLQILKEIFKVCKLCMWSFLPVFYRIVKKVTHIKIFYDRVNISLKH